MLKTVNPSGRILSLCCGTAATAGAIGLLLADAISAGHWTQDHVLVPLIVGVTIASGHLTSTALRNKRPLAAAGFAIAFAAGTAVTMLNAVGRQVESSDNKVAAAVMQNEAIAAKNAELDVAREQFDHANRMAENEMKHVRCGTRCNDWKLRARELEARVRRLVSEVSSLGAIRPTNPKARKFGELATALGLDGRRVTTFIVLVEPLLVPFLLEWTAMVAFGFGLSSGVPGRVPASAAVERPALPTIVVDRGSVPHSPRGRKPDAEISAFVAQFREIHGRAPSGLEVRATFRDLPSSTAYDYARRARVGGNGSS